MALVRPRALERDEAQSLVEFALIVPMLLMLIFGIIDFGMGLRAYISIAAATREGARYASVGNPAGTFSEGGTGECNGATSTSAVGKVCETISGLNLANVQNVNVQVCDTASPPVCSAATSSNMLPGRSVRVTADYRYYYFTPVKALVNLVSAGTLSSYLTISATTDMRIE
jgi:Flp pilus assembly protein TadG